MKGNTWATMKAAADRRGLAREVRQIKLGALGQPIEDKEEDLDKPKVVWNRRQARLNKINITQRSGVRHSRIRSGVRTGAPSLETLVLLVQTKEDGTKVKMLVDRKNYEAPNAI
jgi:hypothetical protein